MRRFNQTIFKYNLKRKQILKFCNAHSDETIIYNIMHRVVYYLQRIYTILVRIRFSIRLLLLYNNIEH